MRLSLSHDLCWLLNAKGSRETDRAISDNQQAASVTHFLIRRSLGVRPDLVGRLHPHGALKFNIYIGTAGANVNVTLERFS